MVFSIHQCVHCGFDWYLQIYETFIQFEKIFLYGLGSVQTSHSTVLDHAQTLPVCDVFESRCFLLLIWIG